MIGGVPALDPEFLLHEDKMVFKVLGVALDVPLWCENVPLWLAGKAHGDPQIWVLPGLAANRCSLLAVD